MTLATWRERAQRVIAEVRRAHPEAAGPELRRLLRDAYPFGQRRYHPYRIWCDEVRRAQMKAATPPLFDGGER